MSVFQEVWHRVRPLTPAAYERFVAFYAAAVVEPNRDSLDVLGGWKFTSGDSNCDVTLYRFESIASIGAALASFGEEPEYAREVEALFEETTIEEKREILAPAPFASEERLDAVLRQRPATPRRYLQIIREMPHTQIARTHELVSELIERREATGAITFVTAYEALVGEMSRLKELWVLPEGVSEFDDRDDDAAFLGQLCELAPEATRWYLDPLPYSRMR